MAKQLKLIFFPVKKEITLPEGYSITLYNGSEKDMEDWVECCRNGLAGPDDDKIKFMRSICCRNDVDLYTDVFFIEHEGEKIATITAIDKTDNGMGYIHMVAIREDYRGKGLGKILNQIAINKLADNKVRIGYLTTDDWRKAACRSYLKSGMYPVNHDEDMPERWSALLKEFGMDKIQMLKETGEPDIVVYAAE